jgi:undecaprenyl-diphosphatase
MGRLTAGKTLLIGIAQAFAMLPGISRSGATIAAAIYLNVNREQATRFSFLMALPVILAGALLEGRDLLGSNISTSQWTVILLATLVAYLSGLLAIRLVIHIVKQGKLQYFAAYCLVAGTLALLLL